MSLKVLLQMFEIVSFCVAKVAANIGIKKKKFFPTHPVNHFKRKKNANEFKIIIVLLVKMFFFFKL